MKLNWYRLVLRGEHVESVVLVDEDPHATYIQAPSSGEAARAALTRAQVLKFMFGVENGQLIEPAEPAPLPDDVN